MPSCHTWLILDPDVQHIRTGQETDLDHQRPAQRRAAIRAGWNDAAWGQTRRERDAALAPWCERGYAGGVLYRQQQKSELAEPEVQASARVVTAA